MAPNFRRGNICRIYMKNFLTYDEIEIYLKPHLNVVIGPNGTGKSSILCAICLGLAGIPEVTGRGKQIWEYVKHGKNEAIIEIELFDAERNIVIKRCFDNSQRSNKSKWYLQGKQDSMQKIKEVIEKKFCIQISNLCQFLPQDRVVEFAKMNKVQLLHSTEKAVGEMDLARQHEILCDNGAKVLEQQANMRQKEERLFSEIEKNDKLKDQVENIKNKGIIEKSIKELKKFITYKKYNDAFKRTKNIEEELKDAHTKLKLFKEKIKPNTTKKNTILQTIDIQNSAIKKENSDARMLESQNKVVTTKWSESKESILIAKEDFKAAQDNHKLMLNQIKDYQKQLSMLKGQLEDLGEINDAHLNQQLKELSQKIHEKSTDYTDVQHSLESLGNECTIIQQVRKNLETDLAKIRDVWRRRLELLTRATNINQSLIRKYNSTYQTALWLTANRNMFKGNVYGPMYSHIELHDERFDKYIENVVNREDLIAFVCEEKDDANSLKHYADRHKWIANVIHSPAVNPSDYQPHVPLNNIRNFGFDCYLKDIIKAPPSILSYLCKTYKIHEVPVSLVDKPGIKPDRVPDSISNYFIGDSRFSKKRSRYDSHVTTTVTNVRHAYFLLNSKDQQDQVTNIENEIKRILERENLLKQEIKVKEEELQHISVELEQYRMSKKEIQVKKNQRIMLERNITDKTELIERKKASLIDVNKAEGKMREKILEEVRHMVNSFRDKSILSTALSKFCEDNLKNNLALMDLQTQLAELEKEMKDSIAEQDSLKEKCTVLEREHKQRKEEAKAYLDTLYKYLGLRTGEKIGSEVRQNLQQNSKESIDELEKKLAEKEVALDCLITADDGILDEYNDREEEIQRMRAELEELGKTVNKDKNLVEECRKKWLPRITELTEKINQHFSKFMARLDCAGEVHLDKGPQEDDFTKYGLAIKVKFRDAERLKDLTAHEQSGGERSVSTALYLMALQTLTAVPFRCVDEINQGMDPTNERKMFRMLVESTTNETASQYFLVTPKLLPDLPYNSRVNFITVLNSNKLRDQENFNAKKLKARLNKRKSVLDKKNLSQSQNSTHSR